MAPVPDLDDVRGVSLATVHALTTAAMIVGVPVLVGRQVVRRRAAGLPPRPLAVAASAVVVGTGLTVATRRAAWALVRLWLRIDEPRRERSGRAQSSGR